MGKGRPAEQPLALGALALVLSLLPCVIRAAESETAIQLQVDAGGMITLRARDAPLTAILELLQERMAIRVLVPDVADRRVSIAVTSEPLNVVLQRLLPPGKAYFVVTEQEELALPGSTGDKKGRRAGLKANLPRKGGLGLPSPAPAAPRKGPTEAAEPPTRDGLRDAKLPPTVKETEERPGRKIPKAAEEAKGRYGRLRFRLSEEGIRLEEAQLLEGDYAPDETLLGDYLYAVEAQGRVLAVGSFQDPLVLHAHFPDPGKPHEVSRAKSGEFSLSLPGRALDRDVLLDARLVIYLLVGTPPTLELSPQTFPRFAKVIRQVHVLAGQEIVRSLKASNP